MVFMLYEEGSETFINHMFYIIVNCSNTGKTQLLINLLTKKLRAVKPEAVKSENLLILFSKCLSTPCVLI